VLPPAPPPHARDPRPRPDRPAPRDAYHAGATADGATRYLPTVGDAYDVVEPGGGYLGDPDPYLDELPPARARLRPRYDLEASGVDGALAAYVVAVVLGLVLLLVVLPLVLT
jgi:hypothetical protein